MKHISIQFARYTLVGTAATLAQYAVLALLVELGHMHAVIASSIGYAVGSIVSYYLNHRFTFKSLKLHRHALWQFYLIALIGLLLNAALMYVWNDLLKLRYFTAQIITTGMVLFWNFLANRKWTFKH